MAEKPKNHITFQTLHHTRQFRSKFISSLSEEIASVVICSPFFGRLPNPFNNVVGFCIFMQRRGTEKIQIITRPPGSDNQALPLEDAQTLVAKGVEIFIRTTPYLHAKMYHFEYAKGYFRSFVGSANFTLGGFERNHEIVAEMEGVGDASPCHVEIARMQNTPGTMSFHAWINNGRPTSAKEII